MTDITIMKLAVFGDPVAHSLSPNIHQQFANHTGLNIDYQAIHASSDDFANALEVFYTTGGHGANLTVPHKQTGLSICKSLSQRANDAGAVNTLIRKNSGWHGDNTDGMGLIWDLQRLSVNLSDSNILIIGAGGATRGIIPALLSQNPNSIVISNRTTSRAQQLAEQFPTLPVSSCSLDDIRQLRSIDLVIHASAAGHQNSDFVLPYLTNQNQAFCYDLSYANAAKPFLKWASQQGYQANDGLGMLVGQAAESFYFWTGHQLSDQVRESVLNKLIVA